MENYSHIAVRTLNLVHRRYNVCMYSVKSGSHSATLPDWHW